MGAHYSALQVLAVLVTTILVGSQAVAAAPVPTGACAEARREAIGRVCADLLRHESRFLQAGATPKAMRRASRARDRFAESWGHASAVPGVACAEDAAVSDVALILLEDKIDEVLLSAGGPVCTRRLARILAPSCRARVRGEGRAVPKAPGAVAGRGARIDRRLATAWQRTGCDDLSAQEVRSRGRAIGGFAAGLAAGGPLGALADEVGVRVGVAIEPGEVAADPVYEDLVARETNSLTAENVMKWSALHPQPETWNFDGADAVAGRAAALGKGLRGHTLVWGGTALPAWVESVTDRASMLAIMETHIAGVVARYAGAVEQWDVVNEPLPSVIDPPTADGLDDNLFRRAVGPDYIASAFRFAHAADPDARLFLNENGILLPGPRQDRFVALVQELLADDVPLHGIGIQGHIGLTPPAAYPSREEISASLRRFAGLGLDVEITELDVVTLFMPNLPDGPVKPIRQALIYGDVFAACLAEPACTGLTTWGLGDHLSWIRTFFGFADDPLLFDDSWARKPAWFAVRAELAAAEMQRR